LWIKRQWKRREEEEELSVVGGLLSVEEVEGLKV
jgi:hypothetical protein